MNNNRITFWLNVNHQRNRRIVLIAFVCLALYVVIATLSFAAEAAPGAAGQAKKSDLHVFTMVMKLFGGLALFLFGMEQMADALKAVAGDRLKFLLAKLTTNRITGALTGAFVTAVIQSSSVTTVLVVGFITAEIMSLSQGIGIIFGANIGTTITAQIIAFKITKYALLMVAVGFGMLFLINQEKMKQYGAMIMGLGLIFFGMGVMSDAMRPLRTYPPFLDMMGRMENPIFDILIAAVFTGLVQSSSATTGIIIVMASQGFITLPAGIALILGSNIGTCVTVLLASIGKPREAVRAGMVHIAFNILGVLLWIAFIDYLARAAIWISPTAEGLAGTEKLAAEAPRQIANVHTIFNVANTLIFLPFAGQLARLVEWAVPDRPGVEVEGVVTPVWTTQYLDTGLLSTPVLAIDQARREVLRMAGVVRGMLADIMPAFISNDTKAANDILQQDNMVDYLQRQTAEYLTRLAGGNLSLQQSEHAVQLLHVSTELEHIGDVIEKNMVALLIKKAEGNITFSEEGREELVEYHRRVLESYDHAIQAFDNEDIPLAHAVTTAKPELVQLEQVYRRTHYDRLSRELQASIESSQIHLDLIDYLRRVNSYAESIARTVLENL